MDARRPTVGSCRPVHIDVHPFTVHSDILDGQQIGLVYEASPDRALAEALDIFGDDVYVRRAHRARRRKVARR